MVRGEDHRSAGTAGGVEDPAQRIQLRHCPALGRLGHILEPFVNVVEHHPDDALLRVADGGEEIGGDAVETAGAELRLVPQHRRAAAAVAQRRVGGERPFFAFAAARTQHTAQQAGSGHLRHRGQHGHRVAVEGAVGSSVGRPAVDGQRPADLYPTGPAHPVEHQQQHRALGGQRANDLVEDVFHAEQRRGEGLGGGGAERSEPPVVFIASGVEAGGEAAVQRGEPRFGLAARHHQASPIQPGAVALVGCRGRGELVTPCQRGARAADEPGGHAQPRDPFLVGLPVGGGAVRGVRRRFGQGVVLRYGVPGLQGHTGGGQALGESCGQLI